MWLPTTLESFPAVGKTEEIIVLFEILIATTPFLCFYTYTKPSLHLYSTALAVEATNVTVSLLEVATVTKSVGAFTVASVCLLTSGSHIWNILATKRQHGPFVNKLQGYENLPSGWGDNSVCKRLAFEA